MDITCIQERLSRAGIALPTFREGTQLKPYQLRALIWMMQRECKSPDAHGLRGGILNLQQGLGKTLTTLSLIASSTPYLKNDAPALVICSKSILDRWVEEMDKFFGDLSIYVLHSSVNSRSKLLKLQYDDVKKYDIVLTTYDTVSRAGNKVELNSRCCKLGYSGRCLGWVAPVKAADRINTNVNGFENILFKTEWSRLILDESHQISNMKSARFKGVCSLFGTYRWCLTGTIVRNSHDDVLAQLIFCGFTTVCSPSSWSIESFDSMNLGSAIHKGTYKSCGIEMPDLVVATETLELGALEQSIYEEYHSGLVSDVTSLMYGKLDDERRRETRQGLFARVQKLRQVCVSPDVVVGREHFDIPSTKIQYLIDEAKKIKENKDQVVVFSSFLRPLKTAKRFLDQEGIPSLIYSGECNKSQREEILKEFSKPDSDTVVLLITYGTGSHGIELQHCCKCFLLDPWWNESKISQAIHRLWRTGQARHVRITRLITSHTIENRVIEIAEFKETVSHLIDTTVKRNNNSMALSHLANLLEV